MPLLIKIKSEKNFNSNIFNQIIIKEEGLVVVEEALVEEELILDGHVELQVVSLSDDNGEDPHHQEVGLEGLEWDGQEEEAEEQL